MWVSQSPKPIFFTPSTRIIEVEGGDSFLIKKENGCKAIGLDKKSEKFLEIVQKLKTTNLLFILKKI